MNEILKQLEGLLEEDKMNALSSKLSSLIEEKASEKAMVMLEEERSVLMTKMKSASSKYVETKIGENKAEFEKLLEESKSEFATQLTEQIKEIESTMVEKMNVVMEEEVKAILPDDVKTKLALFEMYEPIVKGQMALFEEHLVSVDESEDGVVARLKQEKITLEEDLERETESRVALAHKNESLRGELLLEEKSYEHGLTDSQKTKVKKLFEGSNFEEITSRIDSAIAVIEEGNSHRDDANASEHTQDVDINPASAVGDEGSRTMDAIIEEEKSHNSDSSSDINSGVRSDVDGTVIEEQVGMAQFESFVDAIL